jgi:hypothetical protein
LLPIWARSTAGFSTGHALVPHANPHAARQVKALQIAMFCAGHGDQRLRASRADPASG